MSAVAEITPQRLWKSELKPVEAVFKKITNRLKYEEEAGFAVQQILANPKLAACDRTSILNAVSNVASVGLTLNPAYGYAYLVPEYDRNLQCDVCRLRPSYKGLVNLAVSEGIIQWAKAEVVYAKDQFKHNGMEQMPDHIINAESHNSFVGDRGDVVGAYCVAKLADGSYMVEMMNRADLDAAKSAAKTDMVWNKWANEMRKKAVIKRAAKSWPRRTAIFDQSVAAINEIEGSNPITGDSDDSSAASLAEFSQLAVDGSALEYYLFCRANGCHVQPYLPYLHHHRDYVEQKKAEGVNKGETASFLDEKLANGLDHYNAIIDGIERDDDTSVNENLDGESAKTVERLINSLNAEQKAAFEALTINIC